jgi:hypothetical protein
MVMLRATVTAFEEIPTATIEKSMCTREQSYESYNENWHRSNSNKGHGKAYKAKDLNKKKRRLGNCLDWGGLVLRSNKPGVYQFTFEYYKWKKNVERWRKLQ